MADNWMLGEAAALDDYIPTPPSNILGDIAQGVVDYAKRPGQTMAPNPYPPASEEAQFYEDQRRSNTYRVAPEIAMNTVGMGTPFASSGAAGVAGGKMITPGALAATSEYRPPFYSAVEQAVQGAKQNAAPGQQWAGFLRNQPGVKQEEVQALGLGKLFEQPSVSKEAMLGEIAANRVNVGETVKGGSYVLNPEQAIEMAQLSGVSSRTPQQQSRLDALRAIAEKSSPGETKFSQYTLPGGENYREMLLTLPKKTKDIGPAPELLTELPKGPDWDNSYRVIRYRGDGPEREWGVIPPGQSHARAMAGQHPTEAEAVRQALNHINAQNAQQYNQALHDANKSGQFTSSHFDEPNVLAHVRYNDRVIDGKKTLFVEEVQSDWHQKGKREGYRLSSEQTTPMDAEYRQLVHKNADARAAGQEPLAADVARAQELENALIKADKSNVPDAPFKTTWPELAMKRIIREAAEKGYDKVAWTPGSVQAERYDLSKHVDQITAKRLTDGYEINVIDKNGHSVFSNRHGERLSADKLADTIGKDMAQKIINDTAPASEHRMPHVYNGLDLKVGGEGMKGFYDEILPATVNKLVKKHGGRVTQSDLPGETIGGWEIYKGGQLQRTVHTVDQAQEARERGFDVRESAVAEQGGKKVHTLDITPQLRAQAMKGFPLFTAGGVAATGIMGEMARQDEYR